MNPFVKFWTTPTGVGRTPLQQLQRDAQFSAQCAMVGGEPEPGNSQEKLYDVQRELRKYIRS